MPRLDPGRQRSMMPTVPLEIHELFPDEDYRFHLTLRKGDLGAFFSPANPAVLEERRRWLNDDSETVLAQSEGCQPLVREMEALASGWGKLANRGDGNDSVTERLSILGGALEPDFMLLSKDPGGIYRLRAGVVCFPSSWVLSEKIGRGLEEIHGVVPGLNASLAATIDRFLERLKPGAPFERANWGLAGTPELNMHPNLGRTRIALPLDLDRVWLRIEDQILASLPSGGGVLFGIRIRALPLQSILKDPTLRSGFHRALATMPEALAAYKGISPIRAALLAT